MHLRNHRKIAILDVSLALSEAKHRQRYLQWKTRNLSWRDTTVKIHGPAATRCSVCFWKIGSLRQAKLLEEVAIAHRLNVGSEEVQLFHGPDERENALEMLLIKCSHPHVTASPSAHRTGAHPCRKPCLGSRSPPRSLVEILLPELLITG